MSKPRYSICATHYNNNEYIEDSVETLAQLIKDRGDWELIVADAGSDDGSLEKLCNRARQQGNFRLIVERGLNIGDGRQTALENAKGDIVIQVTDLDAEYYADKRIIDVVNYYESLLQEVGLTGLSISGGIICTKQMAQQIGGWYPLPAAEERDFQKRLLDQYDLRFLDVKLVKYNAGNSKGVLGRGERAFKVYSSLLKGGLSYWNILYDRMFYPNESTVRPFVFVLLTAAWLSNLQDQTRYDTYSSFDTFVSGIVKTAIKEKPARWINPPAELSQYANDSGPSLKP